MTIVSQIITDAYRESNLIAVGVEPTAPEIAESFRRLQNLVSSALGTEIGEVLFPWPLGNFGRATASRMILNARELSWPRINSTLIATNENAITVHLPTNPSPGSRIAVIDPLARLASAPVTLLGNGYAIEDETEIVLDTNSLNRSWFFRDDLGTWVRLTDLSLAGEFPMPAEYDDYFITKLAMRINPRYGQATAQETLLRLKEQQRDMKNRYLQSEILYANSDLSFMSLQSFDTWANGWFGESTGAWNRGSPF